MNAFKSILLNIAFVAISSTLFAQNGGFNVGDLTAKEQVQVGVGTHVTVLPSLVKLPPLTNAEIEALGVVPEGSIVYATESDILLSFDGTWWRQIDGTDDEFLQPPPPCESTHYDFDGNAFTGVQIGSQCWMSTNLKVTHYPNGDQIPLDYVYTNVTRENTVESDAYTYYNFDSVTNKPLYGALYSYAAAIGDNWQRDNSSTDEPGGQGVCPEGWHMPTDAEWMVLEENVDPEGADWTVFGLRGDQIAYRLADPIWNISNNPCGFDAMPAGNVNMYYQSEGLNADAYYWTANTSPIYSESAVNRRIRGAYADQGIDRGHYKMNGAYSIRCIQD